jgi:hypothetical protein
MNRRRRSLALLVMFVALAGCASASSNSGGSGSSAPRDSAPPRVRCLSDPSRDSSSNSRPLIFLFCAESP